MSYEAGCNEPQAHVINPANAVTVTRVLLAFGLVALYVGYGWGGPVRVACCVVFGLAMLSDWADGYLARKFGWVTEFGQWFDPTADKIVVGAALVVLSLEYPVLWIVTGLILGREIVMMWMRMRAVRRGFGSMPANRVGKWKTVAQSVAIVACLAPLEHRAPDLVLVPARGVLLVLAVGLSYYSLLNYWRQYQELDRRTVV